LRELDVLLALCKAAPSVDHPEHASKLASHLASCLAAVNGLLLPSTPFLNAVTPSPWEALSHGLTTAILALGSRHDSLQDDVLRSTSTFIETAHQTSTELLSVLPEGEEATEGGGYNQVAQLASLTVSLVGFLEAASTYAEFWEPDEKLQVISQVRDILSEPFLVAVETASSTVRNSHSSDYVLRDWRRYAKRYAASGRPLGSMLLQRAFMSFVTSCTSPADENGRTLPQEKVLDRYMTNLNTASQYDEDQLAVVKSAVQIATGMIQLVEDGSDYLQLGSTWKQRLAFSIKGSALVCLLNCAVIDQESVDLDLLYSCLEDTLSNPDQMASEELAKVSLRAMTVLARIAPVASNITRALLRFIIHHDQSGSTAAFATRCLADVLHLLSQDTVIGTLYSLGNVITARQTEKGRPPTAITLNGSPYNVLDETQQSQDSLVLLTNDGDEEASVTHRNVIRAITTIAAGCNDSKIVALVQSMLLQKVGKINVTVDSYIIEEASILGLSSGPDEFKILLKFLARLYRDARVQSNNIVADAVRCFILGRYVS
jgi:phosphatidylinositol 4-kinase